MIDISRSPFPPGGPGNDRYWRMAGAFIVASSARTMVVQSSARANSVDATTAVTIKSDLMAVDRQANFIELSCLRAASGHRRTSAGGRSWESALTDAARGHKRSFVWRSISCPNARHWDDRRCRARSSSGDGFRREPEVDLLAKPSDEGRKMRGDRRRRPVHQVVGKRGRRRVEQRPCQPTFGQIITD